MSINGIIKPLLTLTLFTACTVTSLSSLAAGQCKVLEESVCKESLDCTWVSAYTTKNGNSVSAYCRSASGKANKATNFKEEEKGQKTGANDRDKPSDAKATMIKEENRG